MDLGPLKPVTLANKLAHDFIRGFIILLNSCSSITYSTFTKPDIPIGVNNKKVNKIFLELWKGTECHYMT